MSVRVIVPPDRIVAPEEISGVAVGDEVVAAQIAAVTGEIDGPDGWLGRALGPQTLELTLDGWFDGRIRLPYPPLIEIVSVKYVDPNGIEQTVDGSLYNKTGEFLWFGTSFNAPALGDEPAPVRIRYRAGYDGRPVANGGTGNVPPQAKQAIIMSVRHLRSIGVDNLFLRAVETEGVGRREYTVSEAAGNIVQKVSERLLMGLRRYS